jgi:hypothetical protein
MPETIVSPGVLALENDQSFITSQPIQAGAAIIGPTPKGKINIPVLVTSYTDYLNKFGATFLSGSNTYTYFTSISAYNYFNNGGVSLLVTRVVSGSTNTDWTSATSSLMPTSIAATSASISIDLNYVSASVETTGFGSFGVNGITFYFTGSTETNTSTTIYLNTSSFASSTVNDYVATASAVFAVSSSVGPYSASLPLISSSYSSPNITFTYVGSNGLIGNTNYITSGSTVYYFSGGTNTEAFVLATISEGEIMNSTGPTGSYNTLLSGSTENFRWQITNPNIEDGTFTIIIRQGNDSEITPSILETWLCSLDPYSPNYIEKVIGNQVETIANDNGEYFVQTTGNYPNISNYVYVKKVNALTPNYFDNVGNPKPEFTGSIPYISEGTFGDGKGSNVPTGIAGDYYENITSDTNIQGLKATDYLESINLLANKDAYNYNLITAPGLMSDIGSDAANAITLLNSIAQNRGDMMLVFDSSKYGAQINTVVNNVIGYNTSYAATYWPWVKTIDPNTANQVWVPASVMVPGVYSFNDSVSYPWFAPAGVDRGAIVNAVQTERILTQGNRDTLYQKNINPIASFPNTGTLSGIVVYGQKTLQKKKSALDRVNVRRLLIELKNYISQIANSFVFEQNTIATRNNFLSLINPYLSTIQQQQGLTSFQVIMDESNNPPSVVDNNQLVGQIYLQPTRTAEFIILDFNILPTGATFPA